MTAVTGVDNFVRASLTAGVLAQTQVPQVNPLILRGGYSHRTLVLRLTEHHSSRSAPRRGLAMTDFLLTALAAAGAYWYVRPGKGRNPGPFPRTIQVFDYRTCPACDQKLPGSQVDIQAHGLRHQVTVRP